jgi:hypothetical protein
MVSRSDRVLLAVSAGQIALFGVFVWYMGMDASQGPSLASIAEIVGPVVAFGFAAILGWIIRHRFESTAGRTAKVVGLGVQIAILAMFLLLALLTPIFLLVELTFEGIG